MKLTDSGLALPPADHLKGYTPSAALQRFYFDSRHEKDEVSLVQTLLTQPNPAN